MTRGEVAERPAVAPFFRFLAWLLAGLSSLGMASLLFVFVDEAPPLRELPFFAALFVLMGVFTWAFARAALARETVTAVAREGQSTRGTRLLVGVYAASLLIVLGTMLQESRSLLAWGGLVLLANLAGCALYQLRRPLSGR